MPQGDPNVGVLAKWYRVCEENLTSGKITYAFTLNLFGNLFQRNTGECEKLLTATTFIITKEGT